MKLFKNLLLNILTVAIFSGGNLFSSANFKGTVVNTNNKYGMKFGLINPGNLGNFLLEPGSSLSFQFTGTDSEEDPFPDDNSYGMLFERGFVGEDGEDYGIWALVFAGGWVRVGMTGESRALNCPLALPPNSTVPVNFEFEIQTNGTLAVTVGDKTCLGDTKVDGSIAFPAGTDLKTVPIMFGATPTDLHQGVYGSIRRVKFSDAAGKTGGLKKVKNSGFIWYTKWI